MVATLARSEIDVVLDVNRDHIAGNPPFRTQRLLAMLPILVADQRSGNALRVNIKNGNRADTSTHLRHPLDRRRSPPGRQEDATTPCTARMLSGASSGTNPCHRSRRDPARRKTRLPAATVSGPREN